MLEEVMLAMLTVSIRRQVTKTNTEHESEVASSDNEGVGLHPAGALRERDGDLAQDKQAKALTAVPRDIGKTGASLIRVWLLG